MATYIYYEALNTPTDHTAPDIVAGIDGLQKPYEYLDTPHHASHTGWRGFDWPKLRRAAAPPVHRYVFTVGVLSVGGCMVFRCECV